MSKNSILLIAFTISLCFVSLYSIRASDDGLGSQLNSPDPAVRCNAAMEVGEKNKREYAKRLKQLLEDKDGRVQYCAAWSLTKFDQKEGISKMLEILQSDEYMEDLSEGFDYGLLAKVLKIKEPKNIPGWIKVISEHPEWKSKYQN